MHLFYKIFPFVFFTFLHQASADYYRFLNTEEDALQCRFDLINGATTEILISYYIIKDDETGFAIMSALIDARLNRGVRVKVLMDGSASSVGKYTAGYLIERGIEVKEFYLERAAGVRRYYHRLHDKLLLVDANQMIVGGRNIKNPYFELDPKDNFKDRDVYVESPTGGAVARTHFYFMWNARRLTSKVKYRKPNASQTKAIEQAIISAKTKLADHCGIECTRAADWSDGLVETEIPVVFIHDLFLIKKGKKYYDSWQKDLGSTEALINLIQHAENHITLENPYIVPTKKWQRALETAAARGVKIRLLTNSIKSNDVLVSQAAYMNRRKKLLRLGIEIWEYQGPKHFHAKTATIDDCISIIGSYNIHNPSERFNSEVAVCLYDERIAQMHRANIDEYMKEAVKIGLNNKPIAASYPGYKKTKFGRRATTYLLRYTLAWAFGNVL